MSFNNDFNNFFPDFSEGNFISPENVKLNEETKKEDIETINIMNDLEEFIDASAIEEFGLDKIDEKTVIDGFKANIFLKLYNDLEKEKNKINDICNKEIDRLTKSIENYREDMISKIEKKEEYFINILQKFLLGEIKDKKIKSIKLPYGTLSIKKSQDKYIYENEKETLKILKQLNNEELINTKISESINKKVLKSICEVKDGNVYINGTLIPDIKIEKQEDKFEIKINK